MHMDIAVSIFLSLGESATLFFLGFLRAVRDGHGALLLLAAIDKDDLVVLCRRRRCVAVRMRNALALLVLIRSREIDGLIAVAAAALLDFSCNRRWRPGCFCCH